MNKNKKRAIVILIIISMLIVVYTIISQKANIATIYKIYLDERAPILIKLEKQISAPHEGTYDNATYSNWIQGQKKDKLLVWSKRDVLVWDNGKKIFVAYKKGGKQYKKQHIFIYQFPEYSDPECINFPYIEVNNFDGIRKYYDYKKTGRIPIGGPIQ